MFKKFIAFILVFCFINCIGYCENNYFSNITNEELQVFINQARNELFIREMLSSENKPLFEEKGVSLYLTGTHEITGFEDHFHINFETVLINNSDIKISLMIDSAYINGWEVFSRGISETFPGKKQKENLSFSLSDAGLSSFEEIEEIEIFYYLIDSDSYQRYYEPEQSLILYFDH